MLQFTWKLFIIHLIIRIRQDIWTKIGKKSSVALSTYEDKNIIAGSLESANSSILVVCSLFKDLVGEKSGFYVN